MAYIIEKVDTLIAKIKEAEEKYHKESPCLHCGPGNGCDDCRGCEDAEKNFKLQKERDAAYDEFKFRIGISYHQYKLQNEIKDAQEEYDKLCKMCRECGGNFNDDCRDCGDFNTVVKSLENLEWLKDELKRKYDVDFDKKDEEKQEMMSPLAADMEKYIESNTPENTDKIIKDIDNKIEEVDKKYYKESNEEKLKNILPVISDLIHKKFQKKKDRGKNSYFTHLETVAMNTEECLDWDNKSKEDSISGYIVGLCHDLFEDTDCTEEEFRQILDDDKIINAIKLCTRLPFESYREYIKRIKISANPLAIQVKISDLEDNMNIKRLNKFNEKDFERIHKYFYSWKYLMGEISLNEYFGQVKI